MEDLKENFSYNTFQYSNAVEDDSNEMSDKENQEKEVVSDSATEDIMTLPD